MSKAKHTRNPRRRGLTLVELLLALMITGMIGAAIAAMLAAVSYGTDSAKDIRSLVARNKALNARIAATIRSSTMVLESGSDYLVLWTNDSDEDGEPSLLEIRRLDFDSGSNEFSSYVAPDGTTDVYYQVGVTNFGTTTAALMGTASFPKELWATQVVSWTKALDDADATQADLVSFQIELMAGDLTDTAIAAVSLRN